MGTLSASTLQQTITNVRNFLGQPDPNNSQWTDSELATYINDGIRKYFGEVVQNSEGQFTTTTNLNIVAGTETVSLPTDCFEVKKLYKKVGTSFIPLAYNDNYLASYSTEGGTNSNSYLPYFYFRGNDIVLRPTPNFSETAGLQLEYIQFPSTMLLYSDTMTTQVSPIFKDLVEAYVVYRAKLAESTRGNNVNTYSAIKAHHDELYGQFKEMIQGRAHYPYFTQPFNPEEY